MARTKNGPQPYFKSARNCWYVVLPKPGGGREDVRLDPDKEKAFAEWHKIMAGRRDTPKSDGFSKSTDSPTATVRQLIGQFLKWGEANSTQGTQDHYKFYLAGKRGFAGFVSPKLRVADLRPHHVDQFVTKHWPDKPVNLPQAVKRPFNWAVEQGYLTANPLTGLAMPVRVGRGGDPDAYVSPDEFAAILKLMKSQALKDYCTFMYETGCRAEEINIIQTSWYKRGPRPKVVIPVELTKSFRLKKAPKPRLVYLNKVANDIAARYAAAYPVGELFRNGRGKPWTANAVDCGFKRLAKKHGRKICATMFRHSFITNSLMNGLNPVLVAKLVGHSSLKMIMEVYEHLEAEGQIAQGALEQATRKPTPAPESDSAQSEE